MSLRSFSRHVALAVLLTTRILALNGYTQAPQEFFSGVQNFFWKDSRAFVRTDLFFGSAKPGGRMVTDSEWAAFLDNVITPRFPDGLTVVQAAGRFRDLSGRIVEENTRVLILLYPSGRSKHCTERIEEIRNAYKSAFNQQSVLRLDYPSPVWASF